MPNELLTNAPKQLAPVVSSDVNVEHDHVRQPLDRGREPVFDGRGSADLVASVLKDPPQEEKRCGFVVHREDTKCCAGLVGGVHSHRDRGSKPRSRRSRAARAEVTALVSSRDDPSETPSRDETASRPLALRTTCGSGSSRPESIAHSSSGSTARAGLQGRASASEHALWVLSAEVRVQNDDSAAPDGIAPRQRARRTCTTAAP